MKEYTSIIFDIAKMEDGEERTFEVSEDATILFGAAILGKKLITLIKFRKVTFENRDDSLFIEAFSGHINVATIVADGQYTLTLDDNNYFVIRPTREYDYRRVTEKEQKNKPL